MFRVTSLGRVRWPKSVLLSLVLLGVLLSGSAGAGAYVVGTPSSPSSPGGHGISVAPSSGHAAVRAPHSLTGVHPSAAPTSGNLTFYGNNTTFAPSLAKSGNSCTSSTFGFGSYSYFYHYCYGGATDPTVVQLHNGETAVGYSVATGQNIGSCPSATGNVSNLVAFAVSPDGGHTFSSTTMLGNVTCKWYNAIEPSFAVAPNGDVVATYVEENYSGQQQYFSYRVSDALAFSVSTNNGATFSAPITINSSGNIARPQVAVFGSSVYVLYENISSSTSTISWGLSSCCGDPISLHLLYSPNLGTTWQGPYTLPGENSSAFNDSMGGWLQVNATGTLGVSYFTNHSCVYYTTYCYRYGDNLVFATSTTNGSSWSSPVTVATGLGEVASWSVTYLYSYFDSVPQSQFTFDATGNAVYIAYTGTYSKNTTVYYYYNYEHAGIFEATGTISGTTWSVHQLMGNLNPFSYDNGFHPAIGMVGSTIYLAFSWENTSYCYGTACGLTQYTYSEWVTSSTDGVTWAPIAAMDAINMHTTNTFCSVYCANQFTGFQASIGSTANATPVVGFSLALAYFYTFGFASNSTHTNYYYNYSYPAQLEVAFPYTGPTVAVNFTEQNLPVGTNWSFTLDGATVATTNPSYTVLDVPSGITVAVAPNAVGAGFWQIISPSSSVPNEVAFTANSTVWFNYSVSYGISLKVEPPNINYAYLTISYGGSNYYTYYSNCPTCIPYNSSNPAYPWYFPLGATITIMAYGNPLYPSYWTGTGPGAYNGMGLQANLTIGGVINETAWYGGFGTYDVQVNPVGLPATTTYSFDFDGTTYSAAGTTAVTVHSVGTGAHFVTNAQAAGTTAGWEYFGLATPANPVIIPDEPIINISFAYVNVAAAEGTVTFQAQGLSAGTVWTFGFNGTVYSSSTPWINVTTRPGTFPIQGFPVTALNSSVGYVPSGLAATMSVTTGSTYTVSFTQAFKVQVLAGNGGSVTGASTIWAAPGAAETSHATAHANYEFGGWTGTGIGSYTGLSSYANFTVGGPIVETANFYPLPTARFNLTFVESGLANGTWWTVFVGGTGYSSNGPTFVVPNLYPCGSGAQGNYNITVPYAYSSSGLTRFVPTSHYPPTICTNGATVLSVSFAPQYFLTLQSTPGGYAEATVGLFTTTSGVWVPSTQSVQLSAVAVSPAQFVTWIGNGSGAWTGSGASQSIVLGGPVVETAVFATPPVIAPTRYTLDLKLAGPLATGTPWSVTLGGTTYSSTAADLFIPGLLNGTYALSVATAYAPDGLTQYSAIGAPSSVTISHNQAITVSFSTAYWVTVAASAGGQATPASRWVAAGGSLLLNASPEIGYTFVGWSGSGASSYTGPDQVTTLRPTGPVTEVALFQAAPASPGSSPSTSSTSFWSAPSTWAIFAVLGLVVGLVVGLLLTRRRRMPPLSPAAVEDVEPAASEMGTPEVRE